jgi:hypothetical protein
MIAMVGVGGGACRRHLCPHKMREMPVPGALSFLGLEFLQSELFLSKSTLCSVPSVHTQLPFAFCHELEAARGSHQTWETCQGKAGHGLHLSSL